VIEVQVDARNLTALGRVLRAEADGAALKKDLVVAIRAAVSPGVSAVQGKLRAIPSKGISPSPSLSSYLASRVKVSVRFAGRSAGVRIRIAQTPTLRGFKMAARRLNRTHWRHPVYGRGVWVTQQSPIPDYFDGTLSGHKSEYHAAVIAACEACAARIGRRF
jgi:hypothetical protein